MNFRETIKRFPGSLPAILIGFAAFFLITGGGILWPTNIDWLMWGDPGTYWIGWQYFRYTPLLQWPLGANPDLGMEIGSSIVFTDSIPLMAFFFKLLNPFLPDIFQYTGLWLLICFSLQSFFAWKLLSLFTSDKYLPLMGSIFFIIAPIGLWRLGGHYSLFGHWVLLAGLYLYFAKNSSLIRWIGLLALSALIHANLLVLVLAIWFADLMKRCFSKQEGIGKTFGYFVGGAAITVMMMWAAGYFMLGKGVGNVGTLGFGILRMNLLALIDPKGDIYSKLIPTPPTAIFDDTDGFNFMGSGMLGLGAVALYLLLCNLRNISKTISRARLMPLLMVFLALFLYAISNQIAIGPYEMFSYALPSFTEPLTSAFRCSGRFFWPVYYAIYLAIFYLLFTRLKRNVAALLCLLLLLTQLIDSRDALSGIRSQFIHPAGCVEPVRSQVWRSIAQPYHKMIFVPPRNYLVPNCLLLLAARHRMAVNASSFARVNPEQEQKARDRLATAILNNELSPDSIYIFEDDALWKFASNRIGPSDVAGILDGYRIIAPKLRECKTCNMNAIASIPAGDSHRLDYKMERLSFKLNGNGEKYQAYGWSEADQQGAWSDGDVSFILLPLFIVPKNDLELLLDGHAFIVDKHPSQEVCVLVNGHHLATLKYDQQFNGGVRVVKIPRSLVLEKKGQLLIKFEFNNPKSPSELGLSNDPRRLGLCIKSLALRAVDELEIYTK
jgi:hypothetical protein